MKVWVVTCGQWSREAIGAGMTKAAAVTAAKAILDKEAQEAGDKPWSRAEIERTCHIARLDVNGA